MKRIGIYAHYDAQAEVKDYVIYHLRALRPLCDRLIFVSTAPLAGRAIERAEEHCDQVRLQENVGLDFCMWKPVIAETDLSSCEELVLMNSSVFGPIRPLEPIVDRMSHAQCDFWGMTDSNQHGWHLQSYFLVFKRAALISRSFSEFWASVLPYRDKSQVIRSYEMGLSIYLTEAGLRGEAVVPLRSLFPSGHRALLYRYQNLNVMYFYPSRYLDHGMPFVKTSLLRCNPIGVPLEPVRRRIRDAGYDERLIEFDSSVVTAKLSLKPSRVYFLLLQPTITSALERLTGNGV